MGALQQSDPQTEALRSLTDIATPLHSFPA
jgi:hypothetical protein